MRFVVDANLCAEQRSTHWIIRLMMELGLGYERVWVCVIVFELSLDRTI
jgi:hypothetical protein